MKHMLFVVLLFLPYLTQAGENNLVLASASVEDHTYTVIINNACHRDIKVAIHYEHPEKGWITQGWWQVDGRSELPTDIVSSHYQIYMHGDATGRLQWPPPRSKKHYNSYPVLTDQDFILEEGQSISMSELVKFSLKEITPSSMGLKARFDC